jgi:hypothetical protein
MKTTVMFTLGGLLSITLLLLVFFYLPDPTVGPFLIPLIIYWYSLLITIAVSIIFLLLRMIGLSSENKIYLIIATTNIYISFVGVSLILAGLIGDGKWVRLILCSLLISYFFICERIKKNSQMKL